MFSYSRMRPRKDCREVGIKGAFPGADVVRGKDWNLEDKDGEYVFYDCQICYLHVEPNHIFYALLCRRRRWTGKDYHSFRCR